MTRPALLRSVRSRVNSIRSGREGAPPSTIATARNLVRLLVAVLREARAVYSGQRRYFEQQFTSAENHYALRRNIHRLEKGLISRPRRETFALDYIRETVNFFAAEVRSGPNVQEDEHLRWARDVLDNYFEAVDPHPTTTAALTQFRAVREQVSESKNGRCAPSERGGGTHDLPTFDQMLGLARRRRSVRWFEPRPVPRTVIHQALQVAAQAPSACNRQPFEFRIFDEPEKVRRVAALAAGTKGFNENFPAVAVIVGRLRAYFHEKDRHVIYIDGALAAMSFLFALETLGLSSCCINWPDVRARDEKMHRLLGLADDERVIMLIAFGFADPKGLVPFSGKRSISSLASFNRVAE
jgi:nitroreductase